jgi:hypothetical protein
MDTPALGRTARAALPIVSILSFTLGLAATLAVAGDTLGFDFLAYHQAAARLLAGHPLYDMSYTQTGGFGLFYYPPTFAPFLLPVGAGERDDGDMVLDRAVDRRVPRRACQRCPSRGPSSG